MVEIVIRFILLIILIGFVRSDDQNIVSVRLKNGLINGKIERSVDGKQLNVFRGIPYAEPPVGTLRFKRPLPVKEWTEPINAFETSNVCPQDRNFLKMLGSTLDMSEDCLYLNIWSPIDDNDISKEKLKPVMFWIHGGAFQLGSASEMQYNGQVLAAMGDVVFVSINYRLNALGFLYSGTDDAPGNVGLLDQVLALEWVKDNIKYFGGDPDKITIIGESAGSWSVSLHLLSPMSRNLFQNAIMNSGAYIYNFVRETPEDHIRKWRKGAQLIGCSDDQNDDKITPKIMECLRSVGPEKLATIESLPQMNENSFKFFTNVVVDGQFLPEAPIKMLRSKDFNRNVNLMMSTTGDEGSFLLAFAVDMVKYHPVNPQNLSFSEAYDDLARLSEDLLTKVPVNGQDAAKLYFTGLSDKNDFNLLRRTIGIAIGDYYLGCPSITFAKEFFKNSDFKSNVYEYHFNHKSEVEMPMCSKWMGVCHASDIIFTFGLPFVLPDSRFTQRDRQISAQIIQFLTDFAKSGVPTPQSGVKWPGYFAIDDNIIAPYYEITSEPKSDTNFGIGLKINECEYFWNKYLI